MCFPWKDLGAHNDVSAQEKSLNESILRGSHDPRHEEIRLKEREEIYNNIHKLMFKGDLQKIMDNAKYGVIYFSLGTMMKGKTMPTEMKQDLLKMFGSLKQTVIWKLEEKQPNVPENVHIVEWAPQASILAHPKTVLFITHGGLLSTTETLHYGVPVIGIPLFADQFLNIKQAIIKGYGMHVPLSYNLPAELKPAINEMINNPKYKERVKELQLIYHDRAVSPSKEMVHWVEHVAKTKGAKHLRSLALITPWYQKFYLDLFAVVLFFSCILTFIVKKYFLIIRKYCIKLLDSCFSGQKSPKKD